MEMYSSSDDEDYVLEKNPLLIDTIIERLMDFLSMKEVKNCRFVCHKWNYFAEPALKKRGKIVFTTSFRPSDFMAHCSQYHHLVQPFTAFSLVAGCSNRSQRFPHYAYIVEDKRWTIFEINEFCVNWGKYIKKLELSLMEVWLSRDDEHEIRELNIDHLFESISSNLEDLVLEGRIGRGSVHLSFNKISCVKNIYLDTCYINLDSFEDRIVPSKIKLVDVIFCRDGKSLPSIIINDIVDFSRCSDIVIKTDRRYSRSGATLSTIKFDFSRDFVNSNRIEFFKTLSLNVKKSKTKTDRLSLCLCPTEPVQLHLKELQLKDCTIDLTLLISGTLEKLTMTKCDVVSLDILPLDVPNLKFLSLTPKCDRTMYGSTFYKILSLFVNCEKLFELELTRSIKNDYVESELDINWIPKSVKILKLRNNHGLKLVGSKDDPMEVDVLIFGDEDEYEDEGDWENILSITEVLELIKTKVLMRAFFRLESFLGDEPKETVSQCIADIVQDKKLEKTIVELKYGPYILKVLESANKSKSCENFTDKDSPLYHEFLGLFLVTEQQFEDFDGWLTVRRH